MMKDSIVVDIDGTIANGEHRLHLVPKGKDQHNSHNWDIFNLASGDDVPLVDTIRMVEAMHFMGYKVIFVTGRNEIARDVTEEWLKKHLPFVPEEGFELYMRPRNDHRPPAGAKTELLLDLMKRENILFAIDDDPNICKAFRGMGIPTYQVRDYQGENK